MKKQTKILVVLLVATFIFEGMNAQVDSLKNLPNLLLPSFTNSLVIMKSGERKRAVLNYNLVDQEMVFMQRDQFFVLDNPQLIDTIYMANRTFIPISDSRFYELAVRGDVSLLIQHKAYAESLGVPTAYGARSQTTSYNYVKTIYGGNGAINLKFPNEMIINIDTDYWILRGEIMQLFKNKRQFLKLFPDKKKELEQFIRKNKTDFRSYQNVTDLVSYCNEL